MRKTGPSSTGTGTFLRRTPPAAEPHALDLTGSHRKIDLADPIELDLLDRPSVEGQERDGTSALSPRDGLEIAAAILGAHGRFLAVEGIERAALLAIDHDHVAIIIARKHRISADFQADHLLG